MLITTALLVTASAFAETTSQPGGTVTFTGQIVNSATEARSTCINHAATRGTGSTCQSSGSTIINSSVQNIPSANSHGSNGGRIITLNYK